MILSAGTPAARARRNSPSETTSMPAPSLARVADTAWLELAFTAKQISASWPGEGLRPAPCSAAQRRRGIAIERRPDLRGDAREADALGVEHAALVAEMVHGGFAQLQRAVSGSRIEGRRAAWAGTNRARSGLRPLGGARWRSSGAPRASRARRKPARGCKRSQAAEQRRTHIAFRCQYGAVIRDLVATLSMLDTASALPIGLQSANLRRGHES